MNVEDRGPGCCASFFLAIPGFLLLEALGVDQTNAFWISFFIMFVGGNLVFPFAWEALRQRQRAPSSAAGTLATRGQAVESNTRQFQRARPVQGKFCSQCGSERLDDSKFCTMCGHRFA